MAPVGKKNLTRKTDRQKSKDRLEVRKAAAVADVVIPALTKQQMVDATSKALFLFNRNTTMGAYMRPPLF